jgi:hypothetical protein
MKMRTVRYIELDEIKLPEDIKSLTIRGSAAERVNLCVLARGCHHQSTNQSLHTETNSKTGS